MRKRVCQYNNDNVYLIGVNEKNKLIWLYPYYNKDTIISLHIVLFSNHTKPKYSKDFEQIDIGIFNPNSLIRSPISYQMMLVFNNSIKSLKSNKTSHLEDIVNIFKPPKLYKTK